MVTGCIFKVQQPGLISQIAPFQKINCTSILIAETVTKGKSKS